MLGSNLSACQVSKKGRDGVTVACHLILFLQNPLEKLKR